MLKFTFQNTKRVFHIAADHIVAVMDADTKDGCIILTTPGITYHVAQPQQLVVDDIKHERGLK